MAKGRPTGVADPSVKDKPHVPVEDIQEMTAPKAPEPWVEGPNDHRPKFVFPPWEAPEFEIDTSAMTPTQQGLTRRLHNTQHRRRVYAAWDTVPMHLRPGLGLPQKQQEFCEQVGVTAQTLFKDRKTDVFKDWRSYYEACYLAGRDDDVTAKSSELLDRLLNSDEEESDVAVYRNLKNQLAAAAISGDSKAAEQWFKLYGQPFIQQDATRLETVNHLEDVELALEVLKMLPVDEVKQAFDVYMAAAK